MGDEETPPWVAQTQATLATIVKKPKLTDNLLKKPPFRFLHDVVAAVISQTGFPEGLFEGDEANAKTIRDKESKIAYLTKLIDCVGNAVGQPISVNPKKIVAGHEPERTNTLLQKLFEAATGDPQVGQDAVQRTLEGEKPAGAAPPGEKPQRPQSSSKAKRSDGPPPGAPPGGSEEAFPEAPPSHQEPEKPRRRQRKPEQQGQPDQPAPPPAAPPSPAPAPDQPDTSNEFRPPANRSNLPDRPQTARRAPPKVKTNEVDAAETRTRPPSGKQAAAALPTAPMAAPNVIGEGEDSDDDDEGMIIQAPVAPAGPSPTEGAPAEHGGLVSNLMDAQKAQAVQREEDNRPDAAGGAPPGGGGIIIQRKIGKRDESKGNYKAEVATLRDSLQKLCQHTNPLGKTMDYIQEDLVNMQKELEQWKTERRRRSNELEELTKDGEDTLLPLQEKHAKAEEAVKEMQEKITVRCNATHTFVLFVGLMYLFVLRCWLYRG